MSEDEFQLFQSHVATRLGVSEETVRGLRPKLTEGKDWIKKGPRLLFHPDAVQKLGQLLLLPEVPQLPPLLGWPEWHWLVVAKLWSNPRYVGAVLSLHQRQAEGAPNALGVGFEPVPETGGPMLRVRVKTSQNLVRGMRLKCYHVDGDLYEAYDLPRRKGRW